jgi:hypothetical protein
MDMMTVVVELGVVAVGALAIWASLKMLRRARAAGSSKAGALALLIVPALCAVFGVGFALREQLAERAIRDSMEHSGHLDGLHLGPK